MRVAPSGPGPDIPRFLTLCWAGLLLGLVPLAARFDYDRQNRRVLIAVDLTELRLAAGSTGQDPARVLATFARTGVNAFVTTTDTYADLTRLGVLELDPWPAPGPPPPATRLTVLDAGQAPEILAITRRLFPGSRDTPGVGGRPGLIVPAPGPALEDLAVFRDPTLEEAARTLGLTPIHRITGMSAMGPVSLDVQLDRIPPGGGGLMLADGKRAPGYPANLDHVAASLTGKRPALMLVEFAGQVGVKELAARAGLDLVGLHSISPPEMARYEMARVMPRWARAISERNNRVLLVHLFPAGNLPYPGRDVIEANASYLGAVTRLVRDEGFEPGFPVTPGQTRLGHIGVVARILALAGMAWLVLVHLAMGLELLGLGPAAVFRRILAGPAALLAGAGWFHPGPVALGAALLVGILAPTVGTAGFVLRTLPGAAGPGAGGRRRLPAELTLLFAVHLTGGLALSMILSSPEFVTKVMEFRGVKLIYLGPPCLVLAIVARALGWRVIDRPLRGGDVLLWGALGALGLIYVLRSGNFPVITGPQVLEYSVRDSMEAVLPVRPRTKEFLVGYPALMALHQALRTPGHPFLAPLLLLGSVAGVSTVNSFCHLHTPSWVSALRGGLGLLFGWLAGVLLMPLYRLLAPPAPRPFVYVWGYLGFHNLGDDLILERALALLRAHLPPGHAVVVLVRDPAAPDLAFPEEVARLSRRHPVDLLRAWIHGSYSMGLGGGLFQDRTSRASFLYYLAHLVAGRALGARRIWLASHSISPIGSAWLRRWFAHLLPALDLVVVRDRASAERVRAWTAPAGPRLVESSDLLFWSPPSLPAPDPRSAVIGLALRPIPGEPGDRLDPLIEVLGSFLDSAGLRARLLICQPDQDGPLADRLESALKSIVERRVVLSAGTLAGDLGGLGAMIAARYHAQVLALLAGLPLLGLSYDGKVADMLADGGYDHRIPCPPPEDLDLAGTLAAWWEHRHDVALDVERARERLLERARAGRDALAGELASLAVAAHKGETSTGGAA